MSYEIPQRIEPDTAMIDSWTDALAEIEHGIGLRSARSEARVRALAYVRGLLSPAERNAERSWQLAEILDDATPYGTPSASTCWVGQSGMRMPFAMICTSTWLITWTILRQFWSSMRLAFSRKDVSRSA